MSLRDFNNGQFPDDPTALHNGPAGNESGLENFHTVQPEDIEPSNTPKIVGAIAVALMVSAAGVALYASQGSTSSQPKQMVAAAPSAPVNTPPAVAPIADADIPAAAPEPVAPVKLASTARSSSASSRRMAPESNNASDAMAARMAAANANDANQASTQPQQQAAVTEAVTPAPIGPSPSPSDIATNNTQSGVAVPQGATTAADIPNPAPAQGANPVPAGTPAPAQPSAQPSGQIAQ